MRKLAQYIASEVRYAIIPVLVVSGVFFWVITGYGFFAEHLAGASVSAPKDNGASPTTMSALDAARLHAGIAEITLVQQKVEALKTEAAPVEKRVTDILAAYKISPADLGKTVSVDFETGAITRVPPKTMPATPVPAQPKAVQK